MSAAAATAERDCADIDAAIRELFADRAEVAAQYAELLVTDGITRGLIGPREAGRIWARHIINSAVIGRLIPSDARVIDLGSGAGLPGIPLAIARPDLEVVLLEPMMRRVQFLNDCLTALALPRVSVHRGRAEEGIPTRGDVVVARAVATLPVIVRLSAGLLVSGGMVLALKGESAVAEVEQMKDEETAAEAEVLSLAAPGRRATVVRITGLTPRAAGTSAARGRR